LLDVDILEIVVAGGFYGSVGKGSHNFGVAIAANKSIVGCNDGGGSIGGGINSIAVTRMSLYVDTAQAYDGAADC